MLELQKQAGLKFKKYTYTQRLTVRPPENGCLESSKPFLLEFFSRSYVSFGEDLYM